MAGFSEADIAAFMGGGGAAAPAPAQAPAANGFAPQDIESFMREPEKAPTPASREGSGLGGAAQAFVTEGLNTLMFNLPRNFAAGVNHYVRGQGDSFTDEYNRIKASDAAAVAEHPIAAGAGFTAGAVAPMLAAGVTGGASAAPVAAKTFYRAPTMLPTSKETLPIAAREVGGLLGRSAKAGAVGAASGAASEFADTKDLDRAIVAGGAGAVAGAAMNPAFEGMGKLAAKIAGKRGNTVQTDGATGITTVTRPDGTPLDALNGGALPPTPGMEAVRNYRQREADRLGVPFDEIPPPTVTPAQVGGARFREQDMTLPGVGAFTAGVPGMLTGIAASMGPRYVNELLQRKAIMDAAKYSSAWRLPYDVQAPGGVGLTGGLLGRGTIDDITNNR